MRVRSVRKKLIACVGVFILAFLFTTNGVLAYDTPGTGISWSMDDLVTNSGGDITGSGGNYTLQNNSLTISAGDTITMAAGDTLTVAAGFAYEVVVEGTLSATGEDGNPITFTSSGTTIADWDGIRISENGNINLAYCDVMYGYYGIYLEYVDSTATPSTINQCNISYNQYGIYTYYYNASSLSITNSEINLNDGEGVYLEYVGNSEVTIEDNTIDRNDSVGFTLSYGGENVTLKGNTITNNGDIGIDIYYGGWNVAILNNTISGNNGGIVLNTDEYSAGDNGIITGNTISDNEDFGIYSYYSCGHTIEDNTITGHTDTGLYLEGSWNELVRSNTITGNTDGIYIEGGIAGRSASSAAYEWIEVNTDNADDWDYDYDDEYLSEEEIGFDFTLGDTTYTHFQVQTNGSLELAAGLGLTNDITDYEGRGYLTYSYPDSTIIFANCDDWVDEPSGDEEPYETHDGASVRMDGWGYKHFNAGDTDGDGNTVSEECLVLRWYMVMISDDTYEFWNDFQVVLYPDGRVRWNTRFMNGENPEYAQYSGIYAGANTVPFEVMAGSGVRTQGSFLYDPTSYTDISTRIYANTIKSNTGTGLILNETASHQIKGNEITENDKGILIGDTGTTSVNNVIEYNNIYENVTLNFENNQNVAVKAENNYWGLGTTAEIDNLIKDDDEDGTLGSVDFESFLSSAVVPPVVSAGDDQTVDEGTEVTLSGSVSDESLIVSYLWEQTAGTTVTLSDASIANPVFTAPDVDSDETLTFRLTVTDIVGLETTDTCDIEIIDTSSDDIIPTGGGDSGGGGSCFINNVML
jgi:parallel beta-helix repeat protein